MSFLKISLDDKYPFQSQIQDRVTIIGFAITILIFSITFSFQLMEKEISDQHSTFHKYALDIITTTVLGILCGIFALIFFLSSNHKPLSNPIFTISPVMKFTLGQMFLYLTLAESLSASLAPLVLRISYSSWILAYTLGFIGLLVWAWLLYFAPILFMRKVFEQISLKQKRALFLIYPLMLLFLFGIMASAYTQMQFDKYTMEGYIRMFLLQPAQPITWPMDFAR